MSFQKDEDAAGINLSLLHHPKYHQPAATPPNKISGINLGANAPCIDAPGVQNMLQIGMKDINVRDQCVAYDVDVNETAELCVDYQIQSVQAIADKKYQRETLMTDVARSAICSEALRQKLEAAAKDQAVKDSSGEAYPAALDNVIDEDFQAKLVEPNFFKDYGDKGELFVNDESAARETATMKPISDKFFYKEMAKIKEKSRVQGAGTLPPKKSASAYIIFQKEKRPEILARNPKAKVTEVVKEIARCWSLMSKEDRLVYKTEAKRDKERYERELKQLEKQSKAIKKPKKCLSAYMIFVKETRPKIVTNNPNMGALQVMQEVGRAWQSMTEIDRKYFKDKADNDKHRYLAESRKFYDEVARVGQQNGGQTMVDEALTGKSEVIQKNKTGKPAEKTPEMIPASPLQRPAPVMSDTLSGKKRLSVTATKRALPRSASMSMSQSKRAAGQVMAIGLAAESAHQDSPKEANAHARLRAESKFTFRPDNYSDEGKLSQGLDVKLDGADNQEEDDNEISEGLLGESLKRPETALHFFCREFRKILEQDFSELKNRLTRSAIKQRWDELTMKQKAPFEQLATQESTKKEQNAKNNANQAAKGGAAARRGAKIMQKEEKLLLESPVATTTQLSRTNQRLAREALQITEEMANYLEEAIENQKQRKIQLAQQKQHHYQESNLLESGHQQTSQEQHQSNAQQAQMNQTTNNHANFDEANQGKSSLELDMHGVPSGMLEMEPAFGLTKGVWHGSRNILGNAPLNSQFGQQPGTGLHAQNFAASQTAFALALQGQLMNPIGMTATPLGIQGQQHFNGNSGANQHMMLFGHQNSGEDLTGTLNNSGGAGNLTNDLIQQQQLLQHMTAGSTQQQQQQQHQLNQLQLMLLGQSMLTNPLYLNQQAALQQLQLPQHTFLNQNLINMLGNKMASMSNNQSQLSALDMISSNQQNSQMLTALPTPQFAGMNNDSIIGDNDVYFAHTLPTAATQPIHNIFNPTSTIEENVNFSNLLSTQNMNAAAATPVTQQALNGLQNPLFKDFLLPDSVQHSHFSMMGHENGPNAQQPLFGQDTLNQNKSNNQLQQQVNNNHSQLKVSPQISPQLVPLTGNATENLAADSQHFLNWQQQLHPKVGGSSMQKISSQSNMLSGQLFQPNSNKNAATGNTYMSNHQQATPTSMTFMSAVKDQSQQLQTQNQHQQQQLSCGSGLTAVHGGGAPSTPNQNHAAQANNQEQLLNSTCVTPFLKPTARPNDQPVQQQGVLSSPFLKATYTTSNPNQSVTTMANVNFGSLLAPSTNPAQISPINKKTNTSFHSQPPPQPGHISSIPASLQQTQQQQSFPPQQQQTQQVSSSLPQTQSLGASPNFPTSGQATKYKVIGQEDPSRLNPQARAEEGQRNVIQ